MQEELTILIRKYLENSLSAEEELRLDEMLLDDASTEVISGIMAEDFHNDANLLPEFLPVRERNYEALRNRLQIGSVTKLRRINRWRWIAAAIIVIAATTAIIIYPRKPVTPVTSSQDVQPGREGAILTLANGTNISLDTVKNATVALQGGVTAKVVNGSLIYEGVGDQVVYNTMTTPKGRQFQLTLPDGTQVWLNSASSIRYPTIFNGNQRLVEITGEVYFEVAKLAAKPFAVNVNGKAEIRVLGTHFNVNAYSNEASINTTLMEGSIAVAASSDQPVTLKPGQQAQIGGTREIRVIQNADVEKVMAWKNGLFNFEDVPLEEAMRQLERWYDIEVVYENGVPNRLLAGEMTRDVTLNDLLTVLGKIRVKCRLEGRKMIVSK